MEVLSQEDKSIVLAFATAQGMREFETRLSTLARNGTVTRKELLFAIADFESWTPEDRTGVALREQGFPVADTFVLDAELWPQERTDLRQAEMMAFKAWLEENQIERLDDVAQPSLMMVRVRCNRTQAEALLRHRDVRMVDLPPRLGISVELLTTDVNSIPAPSAPDAAAPAVAVLDSGLTPGHPLLGQAVGDAQGYVAGETSPNDTSPHWHGTFVGGIALYGDVEACVRQRQFVPQLRLFSGKVFKDDDQDQTEFVEKAVERAVRDLQEQYGCRVFNLSYGDRNKIYDDRHLRGLAYTLDRLTRELVVLFVVPTGNLYLEEVQANYPDYLFHESARLLDPATALNVLTVGGLAHHEASRDAQRYPDQIEERILARSGQPSPLTRTGPSINGAIKPDLVEHAGNVAINRGTNRARYQGLGVLSLNGGFGQAGGGAFRENVGTSYAAPLVAHKAARLLQDLPDATPNLLRAMLGVHAYWPAATEGLLKVADKAKTKDRITRFVGYGQVNDAALYRSLDDAVTLLAEEHIANNQHHIFELPSSENFWQGRGRTREVSVALAYSPEVRTTRLDYRKSKLSFSLVTAGSLAEVEQGFQRNRAEGMRERDTNRWLSNQDRKDGTLQVSRWTFQQALAKQQKVFVVVTRQDTAWAIDDGALELYALALVLTDRENASALLYAQVNAELQLRAQARTRVRV
ncbi:MAG: S8 family peptidase [Limnohabitans sp.]|uniref:S8 family peptidase n=1 Tax=Limnohabitans sp. TaxID=1907725 RepID=UPI00391AFB1F